MTHPDAESTERQDVVGPCVPWRGNVMPSGYGQTKIGRRHTTAHRAAYMAAHGTIPDGLVIDHLCRNRACVNPEHLQAVTDRVNILRGDCRAAANARKTTCSNGHALVAVPGAKQRRACVECRPLLQARHSALAHARSLRNAATGLCVHCSAPAAPYKRCKRCRARDARRKRSGTSAVSSTQHSISNGHETVTK